MTKLNLTKAALLAATAFFAATSAHAQVADTWEISTDVIVTATNADTGEVKLDGTNGATIDGANIAAGYKNSISGAAVGSSASQSFTAFNAAGAGFGTTAVALLDGNVSVTSANLANVSNINSLTGTPTIAAGQGNSISLAAVGSSASGGGTMTAANTTDGNTFGLTIGGTATIQSGDGVTTGTDATGDTGGNAGVIALNLGDTALETPTITTGSANSISAAGVGSSASFGLTFNTGGAVSGASTIATDTSVGDTLTVTSTNTSTGDVAVSADGTDAGANTLVSAADIAAGTGNSISVAAVGSSASVSVADNVYSDASGTTGTVSLQDVQVNSLNEGAITNNTQLTDSPTINGSDTSLNTNNSISVAGVGSSASVGFSVTDYSGLGTGVSALGTTANSITVGAVNVAAVTVNTGMATPTIEGGLQNSISAAAVGASASQSISHTMLPGL